MWLTDLADGLRARGLTVVEVDKWKTRGYAGNPMTAVVGTMAHHTATHRSRYDQSDAPTLNMCTYGRAGLAGPLCHIVFGRTGVCYIVAAGWANHAGSGKWTGIPWHMGNHYTVGVEMESSGITPWDWTADQLRVAPYLYAALEDMYDHHNTMSHQEYSDAGKIDPAGWPSGMDGLRKSIKQVRRGTPAQAPKPIIEKEWSDMATKQEIQDVVRDELKRYLGDVIDVPKNQPTGEGNDTWTFGNALTSVWDDTNVARQNSAQTLAIVKRIAEKTGLSRGEIDNIAAAVAAEVKSTQAAEVAAQLKIGVK